MAFDLARECIDEDASDGVWRTKGLSGGMEMELREIVGLADAFELMAATWGFPDAALAEALSNGSYAEDAASILGDCSAKGLALARAAEALDSFCGREAKVLADQMRKGYSLLFLAPGSRVPIWPYEAAFLYVAGGKGAAPSLFLSPATIDVKRHMEEAGMPSGKESGEPSDSIRGEFYFLSFLCGNAAIALREEHDGDARVWLDRAFRFWDKHASKWVFAFMDKTKRESPHFSYGIEYGMLAQASLEVLGASDVLLRNW